MEVNPQLGQRDFPQIDINNGGFFYCKKSYSNTGLSTENVVSDRINKKKSFFYMK